MSREVIGDAPAGVQVAVRTSAADDASAPPAPRIPTAPPVQPQPQPPREGTVPRRLLPALAALGAMILVVTGWTAYRLTSPPGDPARGVLAVVTGATAASTAEPSRRALLGITIHNPGPDTITVSGYADTTRSSGAVGLDEPTAHVSPGERVELSVDIALDCARAAPLLLPDLIVEGQDGGERQIPAVGAVAALMSICATGPPEGQPLTVLGTRRDGDALVVTIASPSNRRTEIQAVRAAGVALDAGQLPVNVDRRGRELRLAPPATCPRPWRQDGIPQLLDVQLDTAGPSISLLRVGKPLASWALDVVCRGVP